MRLWCTPAARLVAALALAPAIACGSGDDVQRAKTAAPTAATRTANRPAASAATPEGSRPRIVALGDSLTAGLGLPPDEAYPALLQKYVDAAGLDYEIVNAGVSGDTSAGGLSRLDWALAGDVRVLIVALGANDGLRGLPAEQLTHNLAQIIERAQARDITVVLAGMEAPPNYGRTYLMSFHKVYLALAERYHVELVPFLLQGVAGDEKLNQPDGIHPTAEGARVVAGNVWTVLKPIVEGQRRTAAPQS